MGQSAGLPEAEVLLDCLHLNLQDSGGVARYTARLQEGLVRHAVSGAPPRFRFEAVQVYPLSGADGEPAARTQRPSLGEAAKAVARDSLPPAMTRILGGAYRRLRSVAARTAGALPEPFSPDAGPSRRRLVHQVMQYIVGSTVERLAADAATKICVTVIDHQELFFPDFFAAAEVARRHASSQFFARRSDHCFAISQFSKDVFCERYQVDPARVTVTHLAPDLHDAPSPSDLQWAREHGRYFLYPAKPWAHKNHARLFGAVSRCAKVLRSTGVRLVLTGGFAPEDVERVGVALAQHGIADLVRYTGFVTEAQLGALYAAAEWMVFPSLFEGFGMPVVEAMQMGCPVMASNVTALPEVTGDAAILFDATDVSALAELLSAAARAELDRGLHIERGTLNARRFRWQDTVARTIDGYAELL